MRGLYLFRCCVVVKDVSSVLIYVSLVLYLCRGMCIVLSSERTRLVHPGAR